MTATIRLAPLFALLACARVAAAQDPGAVPIDGKFHVASLETRAHAPWSEVRVRGRVVTADGDPIPGATVRLAQSLGDAPVADAVEGRAADDGAFDLRDAARGDRWRVSAAAPGFATGFVAGKSRGRAEAAIHPVTLARPCRVAGLVVDDSGRPLADAALYFGLGETAWLEDDVHPPDARTDAAGRFVLESLPPGRHRLGIERAGFEDYARPLDVSAAPRDDVHVTLRPRAALGGVVVDEEGRPVAGATLTPPRDARGFWRPVAMLTDAEGRFAGEGFHVGERVRPVATAPGFRQTLEWVSHSSSRIVLRRAPILRVRALREGTGEPVEILSVRVRDPGLPSWCGNCEMGHWHFASARSTELLDVDRAAPHVLRVHWKGPLHDDRPISRSLPGGVTIVTSDGSLGFKSPLEATDWIGGMLAQVTIEVPPPGDLVGRVVAADGTPARGVRVELRRPMAFEPGFEVVRNEIAGDDGAFRFGGVGAMRYGLRLADAQGKHVPAGFHEVRSGETTDAGTIRLD